MSIVKITAKLIPRFSFLALTITDMITGLLVGRLLDGWFRRKVRIFLLGSIFFEIASNVTYLFAPSPGWIIVARLIGGY